MGPTLPMQPVTTTGMVVTGMVPGAPIVPQAVPPIVPPAPGKSYSKILYFRAEITRFCNSSLLLKKFKRKKISFSTISYNLGLFFC